MAQVSNLHRSAMDGGLVLGLGVDVIRLERIRLAAERSGQGFVDRIFSEEEIAALGDRPRRQTYGCLAMGFALKESVIKALGGLQPGMRWTDIRIFLEPRHQVRIRLDGEVGRWATANRVACVKASASCRAGIVVAMAVALGARA